MDNLRFLSVVLLVYLGFVLQDLSGIENHSQLRLLRPRLRCQGDIAAHLGQKLAEAACRACWAGVLSKSERGSGPMAGARARFRFRSFGRSAETRVCAASIAGDGPD